MVSYMAGMLNGVDSSKLGELLQTLRKEPKRGITTFHANSVWVNGGRVQTTIREFTVEGDEPDALLGGNTAPNAVEAVLHALGACLAVTVAYHGAARGIAIQALEFDVTGDLDLNGFLGLSEVIRPGYQNIHVGCRMVSDAPRAALENLWRYAQRVSPVLDIIRAPVPVSFSFEVGDSTTNSDVRGAR